MRASWPCQWPPAQSYFSGGRGERDPLHCRHQPEKALEVYDEAYKKNPHDASLVSRIGQAYVKTHQYPKVKLGWVGRGRKGRIKELA